MSISFARSLSPAICMPRSWQLQAWKFIIVHGIVLLIPAFHANLSHEVAHIPVCSTAGRDSGRCRITIHHSTPSQSHLPVAFSSSTATNRFRTRIRDVHPNASRTIANGPRRCDGREKIHEPTSSGDSVDVNSVRSNGNHPPSSLLFGPDRIGTENLISVRTSLPSQLRNRQTTSAELIFIATFSWPAPSFAPEN